MLENNIYNIDREFDYGTVKAIVANSLQKIANEESLKNGSNIAIILILVITITSTICPPRLLLLY